MMNEFSFSEIASSVAQDVDENSPYLYEEYHLASSLGQGHLASLSYSIQRAVSQDSVKHSFGKTLKFDGRSENNVHLCALQDEDFIDSSSHRKSIRDFSNEPVSLKEVNFIIQNLLGKNRSLQHRSYASAGACFPNEIFLNIRNCKEIEPGFYYLNISEMTLEYISKDNTELTLENHESRSALTFVIIGFFARVCYKYGNRGYRFALIEAGAMAHIIETCAGIAGLGAVSSGGYVDEAILERCGLAMPQCGVLTAVHVGKRK